MTTKIKELYVSPLLLPKENMLGWIKWSEDDPIEQIKISTEEDIIFEELFNVTNPINPTKKEIIIDIKNIETPGYVGFLAKYIEKPKGEINIIFTAHLISNSVEISSERTIIKIVRPIIDIVTPVRYVVDENEKIPNFIFQLLNESTAEALEVRPKYEIISNPINAIDMITKDASSMFEISPISTLSLSEYIYKLNVKFPGIANVSLNFEYKDRQGNIYETTMKKIEILIKSSTVKEIPITNRLKGDSNEVEIDFPLLTIP